MSSQNSGRRVFLLGLITGRLIHIHNYHDFSNGVVIVCVKGKMGRIKVFPMYHEKRMSMQNIAFSNSFLCKISHSDAMFLCKISHFTNCFCIFAPKNRTYHGTVLSDPHPQQSRPLFWGRDFCVKGKMDEG
jgi:hypothetical protein